MRFRLRPEVAAAKLAVLVEARAEEVDDRRGHLVDAIAAALRALLDRAADHVARRQIVGVLLENGGRRGDLRLRGWLGELRPQLEPQPLEAAQELALVLFRHEEADLKRH